MNATSRPSRARIRASDGLSTERFIVKAIGPVETHECWLTTPRLDGHRAFGPRHMAAIFLSRDGAERAIREVQKSKDCSGIIFEIHAIKPTTPRTTRGRQP